MPLTPFQRDLLTLSNYKSVQATYFPGETDQLQGPAVVFQGEHVFSILHPVEIVTLRDGIFTSYTPPELSKKRHRRGKPHAMRLETPEGVSDERE